MAQLNHYGHLNNIKKFSSFLTEDMLSFVISIQLLLVNRRKHTKCAVKTQNGVLLFQQVVQVHGCHCAVKVSPVRHSSTLKSVLILNLMPTNINNDHADL
jgi:hypothetical protein